MSKIYKLKRLFTIEDAAKYLTQSLAESIGVVEVLGLILERDLAASAMLPFAVPTRVHRFVPFVDTEKAIVELGRVTFTGSDRVGFGENIVKREVARFHSFDDLPAKWKTIALIRESGFDVIAPPVNVGSEAIHLLSRSDSEWTMKGKMLQETEELLWMQGVVDLEMVGRERKIIESMYKSETGLDFCDRGVLSSHEEIYLRQEPAQFGNGVNEMFVLHANTQRDDPGDDAFFFEKASDFPRGYQIVIRKSALTDLERRLSEPDERPLGKKERNNLYSIIGALRKIVPTKQDALIADLIERNPGVGGFSRRNLEDVFAEANKAIKTD